nr:rust resistance kinase Lr10-like [Ziziphus jujuba var. spinosa]
MMIMPRENNVVALMFGILALSTLGFYLEASVAEAKNKAQCLPSSCGNIGNISFPFRLKDVDPPYCGDKRFELSCENNRTTLYLNNNSHKFYVLNISYGEACYYSSLQVIDANLDGNMCYFPLNPIQLPRYYLSDFNYITIVNCREPAVNSSIYIDASPCINFNSSSSSNSPKSYFYVLSSDSLVADINWDSCYVQVSYPATEFNTTGKTIVEICQHLLMGFSIYSDQIPCYSLTWKQRIEIFFINLLMFFVYLWSNHRRTVIGSAIFLGAIIVGRTLLGFLCLFALCKRRLRQRHLSGDDTIEEFLQSQTNLMPIRYSYSQIKQMTKVFTSKLGQGGYGAVYKGKLRSGHPVAIKVLNMSKAKGQDFINEVATIGRIHHVNVVRLIGFCFDGSKQALVYEFMPNGSLDNLIFSNKEKSVQLSWKTMYDIAIGVARGIEYLHRGCDMQILHFDIKPHNILLDQNFVPKVSDFGLAKLFPVDDSIVSITAARGTMGYIAPELFYKNIGGISYKADVYSFGMMLMEIVGRRKNLNAFTEHSSKIYYPSWIYDRMNQGHNLELEVDTEAETRIVMKLLIVAFWCIQMKPMDRPSMGKVLEMLEAEVETLQMPSNPFLDPDEMSNDAND